MQHVQSRNEHLPVISGSGLSHTEKVYVTMLGGLHIEMAFWRLCGDLLESSGWTTALKTITEIGNPYRDDFKKPVALDTHNCADASVITTVNTIEEVGTLHYYVAKIFDGTVVVLALPLSTVTTFSKYAEKVSLPFLTTQLQTAIRIDVVWDTYHSESLKEATREKRGKGARKRVSDKTKLPKNWNNFLLDAVSK
ncbi:hypothetical protein GQR58_001662 [Nymphon striatum]|nr:hypothetical protein GQR58_001662 [Nymphon striatum]